MWDVVEMMVSFRVPIVLRPAIILATLYVQFMALVRAVRFYSCFPYETLYSISCCSLAMNPLC